MGSAGSECECERQTGASRAGPGRHHCSDGAGRDQDANKEDQQREKHEKHVKEGDEEEEEDKVEEDDDDDDWL